MSKQRLRHCVLLGVLMLASLAPASGARAAEPAAPSTLHPAAAAPDGAVAPMLDAGPPVMQEAANYVAHTPEQKFAPTSTPSTITTAVNNPRLYREVFGFAYASSLNNPTIGYQSWNMDLLSVVAYFGVHVDAWSGVLVSDSGLYIWNNPSSAVPAFIRTAHAHGVKVVLTLIMFDSDPGTPSMCAALQFSDATVKAAVAQVKAKGIDGINVDYEAKNTTCHNRRTGAPESSQSLFTNFIRNLRSALPAGSYLNVDTYAGSAGSRSGTTYTGFFDISALAPYVDSFFVMAYDMEYYNWGSPPLNCAKFCMSPTAPLSNYLYNDQRVSAEYRAVVPASKVLMGIPYYGRKGCVAGTPTKALPNAVASSVAADGYVDASTENGYAGNSDYHIHRDAKDPAGSVRWDTFTSSSAGCTRELYWDDVTSLGYKYNLVIRDKLRGIGIWSLSYGGGSPELWSLINRKFGKCADATLTADHTSPQIPGTAVTFTGDAFCAGTPEYRFWRRAGAGPWAIAQDYSTTSTVSWDTTGKALGAYSFEVDARNQGSSIAYDTVARLPFRLARCVTPTVTADHASPLLPGTAVTFNTTVTCNGTPEFRFWIRGPSGAWSVAQNYGTASTFVWNTAGLPYGNYAVEVDARVQGTAASYESLTTVPYSLTSCINTALASDKASPQPTGTTITLTAGASCAGANQYRFWVRGPGAAWQIVQDYGPAPSLAWKPGGPGGDYALEVDARSVGSPAATMVAANQPFTITVCSGATVTPDLTQPQVPGAKITVTGGATCDGTPEFRFQVKPPGGTWSVVQDYGPSSTYLWDTTGKPIGFYGLEVDARNTGATGSYETTINTEYSIADAPCAAPTLTPSVASPQATGTQITLTSTTTACPNPIYRFWVQPPGGSWTSVRNFTSSPSFIWSASGIGGTYGLEVDVRDVSRSTLAYDAVANITFTLVACSAATLSTDVTSPQPSGAVVTMTGAATCTGTPEYRFWVRPPGGSWSVVRDYAGTNAFAWNTASRPGGAYDLEVDIRDHGSTEAYEATANTTFALTSPCTTPGLAGSPASPRAAGVPITFTASTTGCPTPEFQFSVRPPGGAWSLQQAYGSSTTFAWGGGTVAGTYGIKVDARNQGSAAPYDSSTSVSYTITPSPGCSGAGGVSPSPASAGTGSHVTFTAGTPSGCPSPEYRFWVKAPGSASWTIVRDYSTSNTYEWPGSSTGGQWTVEVDFRGLGETTAYDVTSNALFTLIACTAAIISADQTSPQSAGATVVFTGGATCVGTPEYRFWVQAPGGPWRMVRDYQPDATFSWDTTGLAAGTYKVEVDVRDQGVSAPYEAVASTLFAIS